MHLLIGERSIVDCLIAAIVTFVQLIPGLMLCLQLIYRHR